MPDDQIKIVLNEVGEQIFAALTAVAEAARSELSGAPNLATSTLAIPSNTMVGQARPEQNIHTISAFVKDDLSRLLREPFVARVEVSWHEGGEPVETYYFSRPSVAGMGRPLFDAKLVTSRAALGRLAEHEAGDSVVINGRTFYIIRRLVFHPNHQDGVWDILVRKFESMPWGNARELLQHESLRQALAALKATPAAVEDILGILEQEAEAAEAERYRRRRKVVDRITLRDQPILDKFQGEVFRLPLARQLMLFGPPGSGKTTTLIKRLAQKRTSDALLEEDESYASGYIREGLLRQDGWAMYSPTELLKEYLGDAFNQEGVPDAGNVRTWETDRRDLARNVLGILRSTTSGRFQLESNDKLLLDASSPGIANLHDDFASYAEAALLTRFNDALEALQDTEEKTVRRELSSLRRTLDDGKRIGLGDVFRLFDQAEGLQAEIKRLGDDVSAGLKGIANKLLNANRTLLDEIVASLPALRAQEREEAEEDGEESSEIAIAPMNPKLEAKNLLMKALRAAARAAAEERGTVGGQSGRVIALIGDRLPPENELSDLGESIATRISLQTLVQAPRDFVLGIPAIYARFRRQATRDNRHYAAGDATNDFLTRNRLTPDETDVLILVTLRNARALLQYSGKRLENTTSHDWLESIKSRYVMQVFVDEATDLSAVQLACTMELSNPRLRSWFACGDLRQRITANGIRNRAEIDWLNRVAGVQIGIREIDIGYRQSERLRDLAEALSALDAEATVLTKPPRGSEEADVWPILGEGLLDEPLAEWLAQRIHEVETSVGKLPSIAVFVDGDGRIDPLVASTQHILDRNERNIAIVGCKDGRVVGYASEVRVFDVKHIKGLEFEAVFFVGIDELAERVPDLFQRFFYVGATRAATFLAVTCQGVLPERLETVRNHFRTDAWTEPALGSVPG